ncbi:hypothetical protein [Treponema sp. C6A8]|uniref:hypothetical protein n=1 Tax=Treponema sp. C6A8 TaxID=1410609 RepID=UPI0012DED478|nr:hypothetical protein [Treponema sp. C6A8]
MPSAKNLPCHLCPTCANYEYVKNSSSPHRCHDAGSLTNSSKCGQDPDKDGTSSNNCKKYEPN